MHFGVEEMNRRSFFGLALGALGLTGATAAHADRYDYRSHRYYYGRDGDERRRREILRFRLFEIADRLRLAERNGDIAPRRAAQLCDRLDDVRDFLRGDRYLTDSEFDRRRRDLNDIEDDFRDAIRDRRRNSRYYDRDRYYDRNRYYDRDRYRDRY
jgi:hypothetical protein